jgi:hypothetical protein
MAKTQIGRSTWSELPNPEDWRSAHDYLSLVLPEDAARAAVRRLSVGPLVHRRANDLLRASGLPVLPKDDPEVAKKLKQIKRGKQLSPVLCLRGDLNEGAPMTIADGYHRICASYLIDHEADIPCRLADLPQHSELMADDLARVRQPVNG